MGAVENIITENLPLWSSSVKLKSKQGRGSSSNRDLYGIKKLRELILDLAVRGLLVPQDPDDEPASVLLNKIALKKKDLIAEGLIKKPKKKITKDEQEPFKLPLTWSWAKLDEITPFSLFDGDWIESKDQDPNGSIRLFS